MEIITKYTAESAPELLASVIRWVKKGTNGLRALDCLQRNFDKLFLMPAANLLYVSLFRKESSGQSRLCLIIDHHQAVDIRRGMCRSPTAR